MKKTQKKIVAVLLCALMILGCGTSSFAEEAPDSTVVTEEAPDSTTATQEAADDAGLTEEAADVTGTEDPAGDTEETDLPDGVETQDESLSSEEQTAAEGTITVDRTFFCEDENISAEVHVSGTVDLTGLTDVSEEQIEMKAVPQSEDEIWTWDEFNTAVKTVMEKSGCQYGLAFDKTQRRYQVLMYQFGASVVNNDGSAVVANSPESVEALEYFIKMHEDGIMPESVFLGTEDPSALFKSGQLAAAIQGSWKISDYSENITDFEWGVTYMPMGTQRANRLGGNFFCAIKDSGKEDMAKDFLKWFYDYDNFKVYCEKGNYMSGLNNVTPDYAVHPEMYEIFEQELAASGDAGAGDNAWDYADYVGNLLLDDVCAALNGDVTAQEAMDSFAQEVSSEMDIPLAS